jgi:beta-lactamase superfamily II metal-dependent hydrolase
VELAVATIKNSDSIVVLLNYKGSRFILTGDASDKTDPLCKPSEIPDLLNKYGSTGELRADVYKADHHASKNGTNAQLDKSDLAQDQHHLGGQA